MTYLLITKREAEEVINAKKDKKESVNISLDLGLTKTQANIGGNQVKINEHSVPISEFEKVNEKFCYFIEDSQLKKVAFFSEDTNTYYKMIPTDDWPTFALSAVPMHRRIHLSPKEDTLLKIKEISPVNGKVLDTCCGLGYTAITSSKDAEEVHTFEKDKDVITVAEINPYSRELFSSKKIKLHQDDIFTAIKNFENSYFDRIIHDPPTFKRAPELYSKQFYVELYRVLKKGGIIYHYSPAYQKLKGRKFYITIIKNLKEAGFWKAEYHEKSSGIRAFKV